MKTRKAFSLAALVVPVVSLVMACCLGWTAHKERGEADVYEASLRFILDWSGMPRRSKVFVSINKRDPPQAFLKRFDDLSFEILPTSAFAAKSGPNTKVPPILTFRAIQWAGEDKVSTVVAWDTNREISCVLSREHGRWKLAQPIAVVD